MGRDLFTSQGSTTVSSGGTTAPSAGTTESWTVASSSTFPAASNAAVPATWFYVSDPANPSEVVLVTNVSGTTWSVTRGADSTTPVTHTAGFTVRNVVTSKWLQDLEDRRKFSVTRYGADPTGSADSTTAFTNCFADAASFGGTYGASEAVIPPGKYKIQGRVAINAGNFTIRAYGAYVFGGTDYNSAGGAGNIMFMTNGSTGFTTGPSNVQVLGGIWDAKGQSAGTDGVRDIFCVGNARNWLFKDCVFRNIPSWHALDMNTVDGLIVDTCRFEGFTDTTTGSTRGFSEAIQLDAGGDSRAPINVVVSNSYCGPAVDGSGLGGFGKLVGSHTASTNGNHRNIRVIGNTCESAITYAIGAYQWENSVIANNTCVQSNGNPVINVDSSSVGVTVEGNTITQGSTGGGIRATGSSTDTVIAKNNLTGVATSGIGIQTNATVRTKIDGNHVYSWGAQGIYASAAAKEVVVTGNTVYGAGRTSASGAIEFSGSANTGYIDGNSVRKFGTGTEATAAINIAGTGTGRVCIGDNDLADWGTGFAPYTFNNNANTDFKGVQALVASTTTTAFGTSITAVSGLSIANVPVGTYAVYCWIPVTIVGSPTDAQLALVFPTASAVSLDAVATRAAASSGLGRTSSTTSATGISMGALTAVATSFELRGQLTITAPGTISISALRTGGTSVTPIAGSYLRLERMS